MRNFTLKSQTIAEKTAKNFRGLLFSAPCTHFSQWQLNKLSYNPCHGLAPLTASTFNWLSSCSSSFSNRLAVMQNLPYISRHHLTRDSKVGRWWLCVRRGVCVNVMCVKWLAALAGRKAHRHHHQDRLGACIRCRDERVANISQQDRRSIGINS